MSSMLNRLLAEPAPLHWLTERPWHPWLIVALVSIGAGVGQLDATIVQLALPTLAQTFDAPLQQVSWVALAYLLAFASFLPIFGRLCAMFGRKSLYIAGYLLFVAASALCGIATSFEQLVAFRALQGVGGALLGANSIAILVATIPAPSRGQALGWFAAAQAIGMSAGPALGGVLLDTLGWRWIFWVTVPFGAVAALIGWLALPRTSGRDTAARFDWGGALLIGPALILVVATLNHVSSWGLAAPLTLGCLTLAAVLFVALIRHERASPSPLVDPRLFHGLAFGCGALAVTLGYALLYGLFFLMSFALEHGYGESPAEAGLRLALVPVAIGLSAPFSHDIARGLGGGRIGPAAMGLCLASVALLMLTLGRSPDHRIFDTLAFLLAGLGLGLFIAPNNTSTLAAVPADLAGAAGSLLNLMRVLGTSLGVAAGATTLAWQLQTPEGAARDWLSAESGLLLAAVRASLPMLALLAIAAAVTAHLAATRTHPAPTDAK